MFRLPHSGIFIFASPGTSTSAFQSFLRPSGAPQLFYLLGLGSAANTPDSTRLAVPHVRCGLGTAHQAAAYTGVSARPSVVFSSSSKPSKYSENLATRLSRGVSLSVTIL